MIDLPTFRNLPTEEIARLVRQDGPKVCVFPINGTRRWFALEYASQIRQGFGVDYMEEAGRRHIELCRLFFQHGIDTLLMPMFGAELLGRGEEYTQMAVEGLTRLATHPDFLRFYETCGVRVRFYGDYRKHFAGTPYAHVPGLFDAATARTLHHDRHRLFFGVFADDATETTAELGIRYHREHGCAPTKARLIEMYYGEAVSPVSLFIGFGPFSAFDMPLLATGNEDLYFTVSPSLYFTERQLRDILYDHLYARREEADDYGALQAEDWAYMRAFYQANRERTLGVGVRQRRGGYWVPLPQVDLPAGFIE